jgi:hypothetical protein
MLRKGVADGAPIYPVLAEDNRVVTLRFNKINF